MHPKVELKCLVACNICHKELVTGSALILQVHSTAAAN
jgi:hypothetical protein